jgi:hypothetical protein
MASVELQRMLQQEPSVCSDLHVACHAQEGVMASLQDGVTGAV